jgi:putative isomerase
MPYEDALGRFKQIIGESAWHRLLTRLAEVNRHIRSRGIVSMQDIAGNLAGVGADLLTGYSYGEFYDWDLYFENIYMSYYGISRYCRTNLEEFLNRQLACGFVARTLVNPRWRQHFKPFLAQTALLGCQQTGDYRWLKDKVYHRLQHYLDYWFWYSDFDHNGLSVWDSADHSGMDNQTSRAGELSTMAVEGVDLNCYLVRELQAMARLAGQLGYEHDKASFEQHAQVLIDLINTILWDEEDGFYYDRHERRGELVRVKSVAGFIPLWLGIVPPDRARRLVHEHLHNPNEFWLPSPIATYAKTEPDYYQEKRGQECNWRGTAWVPINYMIFHGLVKHGFATLAEELTYRTFDMVLSEETTREYYNAETGTGQGLHPFWGWSTLAYFMPLEYELGYDPTDLVTPQIRALGSDVLGISFGNERRPAPSGEESNKRLI